MPAVVTTKNGKGNAKDDAKKKKTPEECVVFESLKKRYHGFHKVGSGSYGVVCSAFDRESETKVAIKRVSPWADDEWDARHTLRELRLMYLLRGHPNVVSLHDAVLQPAGSDDLFIVMELMDSDLHRVISSKQALTGEHVSCMMAQLLLGVQALHAVGVLHRDLKPGNVLVSRDCQVRITDFGLSRCVADLTGASGPEQEQRDEAVKNPLTEYVVTRWYRCPEVLLAPHLPYAAAVDCWSVGCIFGELIARKPLFQGKNFVHQVQVILERLGTPDQRSLGFTPREDAARFLAKQPRHAFPGIAKLLPSATPKQQHMMTKFLQFNPKKRYTATNASVAARKNEPAPPPLPPAEAAAADRGRAPRARRRRTARRHAPTLPAAAQPAAPGAAVAPNPRTSRAAAAAKRARGPGRGARARGAGRRAGGAAEGRWANRSHSGPLAALPDNGVPARHDDGTDRQRRASGRRGLGRDVRAPSVPHAEPDRNRRHSVGPTTAAAPRGDRPPGAQPGPRPDGRAAGNENAPARGDSRESQASTPDQFAHKVAAMKQPGPAPDNGKRGSGRPAGDPDRARRGSRSRMFALPSLRPPRQQHGRIRPSNGLSPNPSPRNSARPTMAPASPSREPGAFAKNRRTMRRASTCCAGVCGEDIAQLAFEEGVNLEDQVPVRARGRSIINLQPAMRKSIVVAAAAPLVSPRTAEVQLDAAVCAALLETLELRKTYAAARRGEAGGAPEVAVGMPSEAAVAALNRVVEVSQDPDVQAFCRTRCLMLEKRYDMYDLEHQYREHEDQAKCNTDFHSVAKADTHIHASAMMTAVQLDQFMRRIYERDRDRPLDDKGKTVGSAMRGAGFQTKGEHNAESLNVQASYRMFGNFKNFNAAFTPLGSRELKSLFMGYEALEGEYLAAMVRECAGVAHEGAGAFLEPRFSIYGRKPSEWKTFARWAALSDEDDDVKWLLDKIRVIDTVDDESIEDHPDLAGLCGADDWTSEKNPPYGYYAYYMHENVARLNALLRARKLRDGVSHGINLETQQEAVALQYLYYAAQVPIGVSPISNSVLFLKYAQNPFPTLFKRGLCVALTTDDPLMFHTTPTPLLEEYATARHAFALSSVDVCEIARNSCVAAFSDEERMDLHNDENPDCTNVPACRLNFRQATLQGELDLLAARGGALGAVLVDRPSDAPTAFEVRSYLGHGATGAVFEVERDDSDDSDDGRPLALKVERGERSTLRFEARLALAVRARTSLAPRAGRVVEPAGLWLWSDAQAMSMPRYDATLADVLRLAGGRTTAIGSQLLPEPVALFLAVAAMEAVLAVHDADVLHLDVKPDNFLAMLGEDLDGSACVLRGAGDVADTAAANGFGLVLIDFGRAVDRRSHAPGTRFETAHDHAHLAEFEWPRAVKDGRRKRKGGDDSWTTELDVYALGVCLHLLCSNRARAATATARRCPGPGTGPLDGPPRRPPVVDGPSRRAARARRSGARSRSTPGAPTASRPSRPSSATSAPTTR
ncbi:adenosine-phosphate deaminase [Aureococcus anophagefferens]|nr:adenosine-phosphate deaminase [Aureococcus anophagefferens]